MWEASQVCLSKLISIKLRLCFRRLLDRGWISPEFYTQMAAKPDSDRFQSGADKYAAYLETPEGRLRCGLAFANLQDFLVLPQSRPCNKQRTALIKALEFLPVSLDWSTKSGLYLVQYWFRNPKTSSAQTSDPK
jgi:hypothetical protein